MNKHLTSHFYNAICIQWSKTMLRKIRNFFMYPWDRYQRRKRMKKRLAELKKRDPFIYD
jgi:hypothetical protein